MAIGFEIRDHAHGADVHVVEVAGEIDLFSAPELKQHLAAAVDGGAATVVVDLSDTTFLDSSSLGILISAHRRLEHQRGHLAVVCDNPSILKTFQITGLDTVFLIAPSVDDAVEESVRAG
jgi:anti-sigma B factor antagonist